MSMPQCTGDDPVSGENNAQRCDKGLDRLSGGQINEARVAGKRETEDRSSRFAPSVGVVGLLMAIPKFPIISKAWNN
ncbi:hypothetical protein WA026_007010 [Henosepilachna vigintioctopunctata]|uniref:Uncharacterized protein n=1 Tax=Henosepilachna vigintioctopunctata TaxID=420089 RepID=A0AAW1V7V4_9CUCU